MATLSVRVASTLATAAALSASVQQANADRIKQHRTPDSWSAECAAAVRDGLASWTTERAMRIARSTHKRGMRGGFLSKGRPEGYFHKEFADDIHADMVARFFAKMSESTDRFGNVRTDWKFSFGMAAAKADQNCNKATGYWDTLISGVRDGEDFPSYVPDQEAAREAYLKGRNLRGWSQLEETRLTPRRWSDVSRTLAGAVNADSDDADPIDEGMGVTMVTGSGKIRTLSDRDACILLMEKADLSEQESRIVSLVLAERTYRDIGEEMGITFQTVERYYTRAMGKMHRAGMGMGVAL